MENMDENSEKKPKKLRKKQQIFVNEYVKCWNASEAARKAGYSVRSAGSIGHELLKKPEIDAEIRRKLEESAMSADEVLQRLGKQARGSHESWIKVGDDGKIYFDFSSKEARQNLDLIKKIKTRRTITRGEEEETETEWVEVELYDSQRALELIGKHHKIFTENVDLTTKGEQIKVVEVIKHNGSEDVLQN